MGKASQRKKLKPYWGQGKSVKKSQKKSSRQGGNPTYHQLNSWLFDPELIDWLVQQCRIAGHVQNSPLMLDMVNNLFAQVINYIDFDPTVQFSEPGKEISIGINVLEWTLWIRCSGTNGRFGIINDWRKKAFDFPLS